MKIHDILQAKGDTVVTTTPDALVTDAMRVLVAHNIGALVVLDDGDIVGIISERDLLRAAADDVQHLATARVQDLMTRNVITAAPDADIREVMHVLSERRIRHLPIVSGGSLGGMISIGDVMNALRQYTEFENRQLHAYIAGTPL